MVMPNFPLATVRVTTQQPVMDSSMYLEELPIRESTREIIRRGWPWYMVECGGGVRTVTAQMLDERSNDDLLKIPGMSRDRMYEIRRACKGDPGVPSNLYPNISRGENAQTARGAFTEQVDNDLFDVDGRPLHAEAERPQPGLTAEGGDLNGETAAILNEVSNCPEEVVPGVACVLPAGHEGPHVDLVEDGPADPAV